MITSLQNPLIKRIVAFKDKKHREREGVFLIEGEKEILHALSQGISLETLIYCSDLLRFNKDLNTIEHINEYLMGGQSGQVKLVEADQRVYAKIAYRDKAEGLVAIAHLPKRDIEEMLLAQNPLILVIWGVEKPGNLGALLRTADGAGTDAVIVCNEGGVDLYNPNVVRGSLGALFTVPTYEMSLANTLDWLRQKQVTIVLTSPNATMDYTQPDYTGPVALVLGSEKQGLPELLLQQNTTQVKIPMLGRMDSLNVSCSGAILLYEVLRQRKTTNNA